MAVSPNLVQMPTYPGKVGLQQRVLPGYRVGFFDALAQSSSAGLSIFAGQPGANEGIETAARLEKAQLYSAQNIHFGQVGSPGYLCWQRGMLGWLEYWQPDILVVEANPRYLSTPAGARWMHRRGRPVIGWGLGAPRPAQSSGGLSARIRAARRRQFYGRFDALIAYSRKGASEYARTGFPPERIFVAPNAVTFRPQAPPVQRPLEDPSRMKLLFVGRLQSRKRIDHLLLACQALPEAMQPQLLIVGDGPVRRELEELAFSVYPQAEFLGALHGVELEPVYARADLFILPGTGGLAVQQAMAHGLPVIVAEGDGTQDDLVRRENGWRVPAGNLLALTATLEQALASPARLRQMGEASYRLVAEEINVERMVDAFLNAFHSVSPHITAANRSIP